MSEQYQANFYGKHLAEIEANLRRDWPTDWPSVKFRRTEDLLEVARVDTGECLLRLRSRPTPQTPSLFQKFPIIESEELRIAAWTIKERLSVTKTLNDVFWHIPDTIKAKLLFGAEELMNTEDPSSAFEEGLEFQFQASQLQQRVPGKVKICKTVLDDRHSTTFCYFAT